MCIIPLFGMNYSALSRELIRALRGARTQAALSRGLGYRSNVLFAWESGRDEPQLSRFLSLLRLLGRSPEEWTQSFGRGQPEADLSCPQALSRYLQSLRGGRSIKELATLMNRSRYVVSRWLSGATEISLASFLELVEVTTLASLDLLALLCDPRELPSSRDAFLRLEAARRSAVERPWSHAIVHMVELAEYAELGCHQPGWFASRLGISQREEQECLDLLTELGRLTHEGGRYRTTDSLSVDVRPAPEATRKLASFWMKQGAERILAPGSGRYGFNTFGVSKADLERLKRLQSQYFAEMRAIIASSGSTETVCVATFQLFEL